MAAPLSLSRATVTRGDEKTEHVSVVIRGNRLRTRIGRNVLTENEEVVSTRNVKAGTWEVDLASGETLTVVREKGCNCG